MQATIRWRWFVHELLPIVPAVRSRARLEPGRDHGHLHGRLWGAAPGREIPGALSRGSCDQSSHLDQLCAGPGSEPRGVHINRSLQRQRRGDPRSGPGEDAGASRFGIRRSVPSRCRRPRPALPSSAIVEFSQGCHAGNLCTTQEPPSAGNSSESTWDSPESGNPHPSLLRISASMFLLCRSAARNGPDVGRLSRMSDTVEISTRPPSSKKSKACPPAVCSWFRKCR